MGVPGFFAWLLKKKVPIITDIKERPSALYIDANCLFHPQCFKILEHYPNLTDVEKLERRMLKRIVNYIDYLVAFVNPTDLVYLAVDGVAPTAKIRQQRQRRFGYATDYKREIYKKYGIETNTSWSNIVITPGTPFMEKLHNFLKSYYKNKMKNNKDPMVTFKFMYSSYHTPGEGEHKILKHIKKHNPDRTKPLIIYGLDADLIFLSMASQRDNIFLLREEQHFSNKGNEDYVDKSLLDPVKDVQESLLYASIDSTKLAINNALIELILQKDYSIDSDENVQDTIRNKIEKIDFTSDFVFLCYLLGNDFLPHLPSIDIKMDGLDTLLNAYILCFDVLNYKNLISFENQKVVINNEFLLNLICMLGNHEDIFFKELMPRFLNNHMKMKCFEDKPYKREIWNIENLKNIKVDDNIGLGIGTPDEWKYRYYNVNFHTDKFMKETVDNVCHNYLEGLLWVSKYYFEECPSWRWQYKYHHAPFLSDITNYLRFKNINTDFNIEQKNPVSIYTQLVGVIPSVYSNLLPNKLKFLITDNSSPIIDMYPSSYQYDMLYKTQLFKCIPLIPFLDIDRVEKYVENIKDLSDNDVIRNTVCKPFLL